MSKSTTSSSATRKLTPEQRALLQELDRRFFLSKARENQKPPKGDWQYWLLNAGRGFGKTRVGSEWVISRVRAFPGCHIALVGPTAADARDVMVEGNSGILGCSPEGFKPIYEPSKRKLTWPNGSTAHLYSAEEPDRLRGPQHHFAWCDELAAWRDMETWDMLQFGLRMGQNPQCVITTTPRPIPVIRELMKNPKCEVTRGSTYDNKENLAPSFIEAIVKKYEGTRLGRQELNAEILDDNPGALWTRSVIEQSRLSTGKGQHYSRIVVGVDPAVTNTAGSDYTGIVVAGVREDGHFCVLEDCSMQGSPLQWSARVIEAYHRHGADKIVAEVNNGGDLVETTLRTVDNRISFRKVTATRGKAIRAEPIASLYEQGRVHHIGSLAALEDQMCEWVPNEPKQKSPDRMDALVWALTELNDKQGGAGRFMIGGASRR